jgi:hypothetical protein
VGVELREAEVGIVVTPVGAQRDERGAVPVDQPAPVGGEDDGAVEECFGMVGVGRKVVPRGAGGQRPAPLVGRVPAQYLSGFAELGRLVAGPGEERGGVGTGRRPQADLLGKDLRRYRQNRRHTPTVRDPAQQREDLGDGGAEMGDEQPVAGLTVGIGAEQIQAEQASTGDGNVLGLVPAVRLAVVAVEHPGAGGAEVARPVGRCRGDGSVLERERPGSPGWGAVEGDGEHDGDRVPARGRHS